MSLSFCIKKQKICDDEIIEIKNCRLMTTVFMCVKKTL
ncbi:hypothetical protein CLFO_23930 [Clostridium formicaceticum]|uniref:Uncharacterized protein n=1 Tax=Clostridium formicaceticum TaxID=1497 RepID=A0AAC9RLX7_9CLOT|nr:hypothetical protein CLFO_23930 [Clostridium formicaceticum]